MLVPHFLALGLAIRLPAARLHAAVARNAHVTMMSADSYLDGTIRIQNLTSGLPSSDEDSQNILDSTRDSESTSIDPNVNQAAINKAEPFVDYLARRSGSGKAPSNDMDSTRDSEPVAPLGKAEFDKVAAFVASQQQSTPPAYQVAAPQAYQGVASPAAEWEPDRKTRVVRVLGPIALFAGAVAGTLAVTSVTTPAPITMEEIITAQREWGDAIVRISKTYLTGQDYVDEAAKAADALYGYGRTDVLFKPTKAAETPFRPTGEGALSYFVGGENVRNGFAEDSGFALGPGGVGWKKVIFDNNKVDLNGATATAMGEYYFYSAADDSVAKVEYTFGYKRNADGKIRIYLHHSSLPYPGKKKPAPPPPPPPPSA